MPYKTIPKRFGWMNTTSLLTVDPSAEVVPLSFVQLEDEVYTVAGYLKEKIIQRRQIFIAFSNMVFYPYLMSKTFLGITEPELDPVPAKLLLSSLEL